MKPVRTDAVLGMTAMTNAEFTTKVQKFLFGVPGDDSETMYNERVREMAREFEVSTWSVECWYNEKAPPHPLLQSQIVRWIETQS